jgi:hypothetical protein
MHLTQHEVYDILFYLLFLLGQGIFILKLADQAARAHNLIKTRRQYILLNWVPLLIRIMFESLFFFAYRHYTMLTQAPWFPDWAPHWNLPQYGVIFAPFGYLSDSILDWVSQQPKVPAWIKAQIPAVPQAVVAKVTTTTTIEPVDENVPVTEKTTVSKVTAPVPENDPKS